MQNDTQFRGQTSSASARVCPRGAQLAYEHKDAYNEDAKPQDDDAALKMAGEERGRQSAGFKK